jgi:hypothetical protein
MFWMRAYPLRGEVGGGGWALEFSSFKGPVFPLYLLFLDGMFLATLLFIYRVTNKKYKYLVVDSSKLCSFTNLMQAGEIRVARVGSGLGRRYGTGRFVPGRDVPGLAKRLAAGGGARHETGGRHRLSPRSSKVGLAEKLERDPPLLSFSFQ